jgi:hypothetical protein
MAETEAVAVLGEDGSFTDGWMDSLPAGTFENDDAGKPKQGDLADHKNIGSVVKSYLNKDKMLGTAIQPLAADATPEQKRAHYTKQGCPPTVEGYEIAREDGKEYNEKLITAMSKYAHDNGISKTVYEGQAKMVIDALFKANDDAVTALKTANDQAVETKTNELKAKLGAQYDAGVDMANRFYNLPGDDVVNQSFVEVLKANGLDSHPAVIEFFMEAWKLVKGDVAPSGGEPPGKTTEPGELDYSKVVGNTGK